MTVKYFSLPAYQYSMISFSRIVVGLLIRVAPPGIPYYVDIIRIKVDNDSSKV